MKILLILLLTAPLHASETMFVWLPHETKALRGTCYEIDTETMGQKFSDKVDNINCRPSQVSTYWVPNEKRTSGNCYEVDLETGPGYLREGIHKTDNVHIFPSSYFYPFVEEYTPGQDPPYRKASKNKCHGKKKTKQKTKKLR
ncbi:MAG: hypothetical protein HOJ35_03985, partial [Bdellovibrionales bacterium]|nr:hypothetical protein [Bdellovibrionales bacterium]